MVSSPFDPLHVPAQFWTRDDVGRALDGRDFEALFGLLSKHLGASQTRIGTAAGLSQGTVCVIMNGKRQVTTIDVLERIADGLGMPDTARVRLGLAPHDRSLVVKGSEKEDTTKRRTALNLGVVAAVSPETLRQVLRDSADEERDPLSTLDAVHSTPVGARSSGVGAAKRAGQAYIACDVASPFSERSSVAWWAEPTDVVATADLRR
ncbi:MAG: helix-turn-helix domain-containing protein [Pseudonocardiaceae bacterium]